jgi:hypothetical protein
MKRKSVFAAAAFGVGVLMWSLAARSPQGAAPEKRPAVDPRLAQLHIQLLGVSQ